jgi:hypothetical protein
MELDQAIIHLNLKMCQRSLASRRRLGPSRWDRVDKWYYDLVGVEKPLWISRAHACNIHAALTKWLICTLNLSQDWQEDTKMWEKSKCH